MVSTLQKNIKLLFVLNSHLVTFSLTYLYPIIQTHYSTITHCQNILISQENSVHVDSEYEIVLFIKLL